MSRLLLNYILVRVQHHFPSPTWRNDFFVHFLQSLLIYRAAIIFVGDDFPSQNWANLADKDRSVSDNHMLLSIFGCPLHLSVFWFLQFLKRWKGKSLSINFDSWVLGEKWRNWVVCSSLPLNSIHEMIWNWDFFSHFDWFYNTWNWRWTLIVSNMHCTIWAVQCVCVCVCTLWSCIFEGGWGYW